jgi:hypothetical protein
MGKITFFYILTFDFEGCRRDGFSSQIDGFAHVNSRILKHDLIDVQIDVAEVVSDMET